MIQGNYYITFLLTVDASLFLVRWSFYTVYGKGSFQISLFFPNLLFQYLFLNKVFNHFFIGSFFIGRYNVLKKEWRVKLSNYKCEISVYLDWQKEKERERHVSQNVHTKTYFVRVIYQLSQVSISDGRRKFGIIDLRTTSKHVICIQSRDQVWTS